MPQFKFSELAHFEQKQLEALSYAKTHKFLLYGGAMGGGKSYFLRWVAVYLLLNWAARGYRNVRVGLFCEDYPALHDRQLIRIEIEFPSWLGKLNKSDHEFRLRPEFGGGVISFRNLDKPGKYASSEFAAILVDELTKNRVDRFHLLRTRMRWPGISDVRFIGATNPGSIGHEWVKRFWIMREFEPNEREADQFHFVPAFASDNPHLDGSYYDTLEGLPDQLRKAFKDGSWDLFVGQFFAEWRDAIHVIDNYNPPPEFKRYLSIDYGRTNPFCAKWYAVDYDGRVVVYREYYKAGEDADVNFAEVRRLCGDEKYEFQVLDAACFSQMTGSAFNYGRGETIADMAWRAGLGVVPSNKNRKAGWALVHKYLRWTEKMPDGTVREIVPLMRYMKCAKDSIRTIPTLVFSDNDNEDLDTKGEDHAADTDSYFLQKFWEGKTEQATTPESQLSPIQKILRGIPAKDPLQSFF